MTFGSSKLDEGDKFTQKNNANKNPHVDVGFWQKKQKKKPTSS